MKTFKIKNTILGEGVPKICVPIVAKTKEEAIEEAKSFADIKADLVELRIDWYDEVNDIKKVKDLLKDLQLILKDLPLLFTFRTAEEGGEKKITIEDYITLNKEAAKSGFVDLIDVEVFKGDEVVKDIIATAHQAGIKVVASNHDFDKTPAKDDIVYRLRKMQDLGADIPKIAVMPKSKFDVLELLEATLIMQEKYADRPIITMSMSGKGVISRLAGEVFGSCLTFGAAKKASAPGQIGVNELSNVLETIHKSSN